MPKLRIRTLVDALNPELRLLLLAARAADPPAEEIAALIPGIANWVALHATAAEHGIRPLLHRALRAIGFAGMPESRRHSLEENVRLIIRQNLAFSSELLHALEPLREARIQALPYKGPVAAIQAYREIGLREFMDLDIMVRQRDVPRLTQSLRKHGYPPHTTEEAAYAQTAGDLRYIPGQYHFSRPALFLPLEFHTEQTLRYYPVPLDIDRLTQRLATISLGDKRVRVFPPEVSLTILSVHGSKHLWNRLQWVADIAWLTSHPNFNWDEALATALELHAEKMALTGLALAADLLEAKLPPEIAKRAKTDRDVQDLARQSAQELLHPARANANVLQRAAFRVKSAPTRAEGLKHLARLATSPSGEDRSPEKPSDSPSLLKRPLRLAKKYGVAKRPAKVDDLGPFVATPLPVIDAMLEMAAPRPDDVLYDPGCGDGAVVLRAAERYGIRGVGLDIDPQLLARAREEAVRRNLADRVEFREQDAKSADFSQATIVTLFLSVSGNLLLMPQLRAQLRPAARVLSGRFDLPGWTPDSSRTVEVPGEKPWRVLLWRVR